MAEMVEITEQNCTVSLPPDLGAWASHQPEGLSPLLSPLLSSLLREEYPRRRQRQAPETDTSSRSARQTALLAQPLLARVWENPEENAAWADL